MKVGDAQQTELSFRLLVECVEDYAIFMLDPGGRILTWNVGAEKMKGYTAAEIIGRHFSTFYPEEAVARGWPEHELERALALGHFEDEGWRVRRDGSKFWANVVITALKDEHGTHRGFAKVTRDLTERRHTEESFRLAEERFRLLIEGVEDHALVMLDPEGRVSSWNLGAERTQGYRPEEIIGRDFSVFYPPEDVAARKPQRSLQKALEQGHAGDQGWRVRKDGTRFWAEFSVTAVRDKQGDLIGYATVTHDHTNRRRAESLEQSSRRMEEFLAMLAHELRNPLAPIQNAAQIMRLKPLGDPVLEWSRDVIDRQVGHMARLVDDLLDMSRITSGNIQLHREPVTAAEIIRGAIEASRPLIDARRHKLEVRLADEPMRLEADSVRLTQVVVNLLNNAAKFTPEGGLIRLAAVAEHGEIVISVRDSGIGIPDTLLPLVFNLFTQGDRTPARTEGGLGIGLTLARHLVELHGGSVDAESEGPGRGSTFTVRLPQSTPLLEPVVARARRNAHAAIPRRVLIVDDHRDSADTLAKLVQLWGHEVRIARDGPDALEAAVAFLPHLVLLDIGMPGMDGYDVARRMREMPATQDALIAAVTGYGDEAARIAADEAGVDRHLVKPVEPEALEDVLRSAPTDSPAPTEELNP